MAEEKHQKKSESDKDVKLAPLQLLIILGLLEGILEVDAMSIDKKQIVVIELKGSLKGHTELEKLFAEMGISKVSFKK
ncbi:MAG TPA: hypothetical protein PLC07_07875 [Bacillota bacterium]|nr:hypothetical protein [Bacillota bacterium]HPT87204.1 hypothetical protein [Bacillota bacterium]